MVSTPARSRSGTDTAWPTAPSSMIPSAVPTAQTAPGKLPRSISRTSRSRMALERAVAVNCRFPSPTEFTAAYVTFPGCRRITVRMKSAIAALALLAFGTYACAAEPVVLTGIPYVQNGTPDQVMDVYWTAAKPKATVLFIHGGSLQESGERRTSPAYA